jgi:hypothetical protein
MSGDSKKSAIGKVPPALDPERLALTQPWRDYLSRGLISSIKVEFTPTSTSLIMQVSPAVKLPDGVDRTCVPAGIAKQSIRDSNLLPMREGKAKGADKEQPLPSRSLTVRDLEDDKKLEVRIAAVAKELGSTSVAGRIGSLQLYIEGADTFEGWWALATPLAKMQIFVQKRYQSGFDAKQLAALAAKLPSVCPFRGTVPTPKEEDDGGDRNIETEVSESQTTFKEKSSKTDRAKARGQKVGRK